MKSNDAELKKSAHNLRGLLNDLKRRPEDAAKELGFDIEDLEDYLSGTKPISSEFIPKISVPFIVGLCIAS